MNTERFRISDEIWSKIQWVVPGKESDPGRTFLLQSQEFRRLATRYEKLLERFASFILIVAGMLWA